MVLGSPVVPQATRALTPLSICQLTSFCSAARSIPFGVKGVINAVHTPWNRGFPRLGLVIFFAFLNKNPDCL